LSVVPRCAVCGADLSKADSGDGPAVFVIFILGILVVPLALGLEALVHPPYWVHALVWPPVILAIALALLRPFKAVLIALQFKNRASESGHISYDE
jgi:uncharacterized protein (DUF983 family)